MAVKTKKRNQAKDTRSYFVSITVGKDRLQGIIDAAGLHSRIVITLMAE